MTTRHPALTAQKLGPIALANRLAVAPMTRVSATPDGDADRRDGRLLRHLRREVASA